MSVGVSSSSGTENKSSSSVILLCNILTYLIDLTCSTCYTRNMMNTMTVKEILEFFGIEPNVADVKRLPLTELGTKLLTQDTVHAIDGEYTLHGLTVMITQTRLIAAGTMKTVVSELRITSGHKGTQVLTPDNIFSVLSTHLTQL